MPVGHRRCIILARDKLIQNTTPNTKKAVTRGIPHRENLGPATDEHSEETTRPTSEEPTSKKNLAMSFPENSSALEKKIIDLEFKLSLNSAQTESSRDHLNMLNDWYTRPQPVGQQGKVCSKCHKKTKHTRKMQCFELHITARPVDFK